MSSAIILPGLGPITIFAKCHAVDNGDIYLDDQHPAATAKCLSVVLPSENLNPWPC